MHAVYESLEGRVLLNAVLGADGVLHITGTAGADVVGINLSTTKLLVGLNGTSSQFSAGSVKSISIDLGDGADRLDIGSGVGAIYCLGGLGDDTINGGDGSDTITAGGGKDSVSGGLGDDRIDGGPTADRISGGAGADRIYGGDANDVLIGDSGVDRLFGGNGNDQLIGGSSNDKLYGDAGDDVLTGGTQNDLLTGGIGNDSIYGGDGADTLNGQDGNDFLQGQRDNDSAFGDGGDDTISDASGNDSLSGGGDADSIIGSDGDDTLRGNAGNDWLDGGNGKDSLDGGDGDDSLSGGADHDQLLGGAGIDALLGGRDEDTLTGGDGADRLLSRSHDTTTDLTNADAQLNFKDEGRENILWTDDEIWQIDVGLKWLQQRTGGTKILKLSNGGQITVQRESSAGPDILGDNRGDGIIDIADLAFQYDGFFGPDVTIVHEIGHNWDTLDENPGIKPFFDLSRWRGNDPNWTYDPKAQFARDYGKTNPYEDYATSLEVYYSHFTPKSQFLAKWNWMENWLNSMSG
jgi:Ca2+-binding RTX toxin-like protein